MMMMMMMMKKLSPSRPSARAMPSAMVSTLLLVAVQLLVSSIPRCYAMYENERMLEYEKRNYTWPPQRFIPDTPGWKALHMEKEVHGEPVLS